MPLGLLAVGSALNREKYDVRIFDARIHANAGEAILRECRDAVCIGMTVFSGPSIGAAQRLSRQIKDMFPALPIIWGGWHPSILPDQCIGSGVVDAVVIGQGEVTFRELVASIERRDEWRAISGLCITDTGKPLRTGPRSLARMDDLAPARYELLDLEAYFQRKARRQIDYSSSRGCPYRCTFCADPMVYKSKWTGISPHRIVKELMDLYEEYRFDEVLFLDDDLFASPKRIQALVDTLIASKTPFNWKGAARADELCRLPEEFFSKLRLSGCVKINVGAESASQRILDEIKKDYHVEEILNAAYRTSQVGIAMMYSFITGFPGETDVDFQATVDLIKRIRRLGPNIETIIFCYSPYPGTELAQDLEKLGLRLPTRLEDWDNFNIEGAWLPRDNPQFVKRVRSMNFYFHHAYSDKSRSVVRKLLSGVSRLRCEHNWYGFPIELYMAEAVRTV